MSLVQRIAGSGLEEVLLPVIREHRPAIVTYHGQQGWQMFKSTFAAGSPASGHLQLTSRMPVDGLESGASHAAATLGVTFRRGQRKCMFSSSLVSFQSSGDEGTLTLRWPARIEQLQRRMYERAEPPGSLVIPVRLWWEREPSGDRVSTRTVRYGQLVDLSVGGVGVKLSGGDEFQIGSTFRCVFSPHKCQHPIVGEALVRHRQVTAPGRALIGLQFAGLETSVAGRRAIGLLAQSVSRFQKERKPKRR